MIKSHIEQAIRNIEAEKENELRKVEQRVMQEKIAPYNKEIDESRNAALAQLTTAFNESVKALQEKFTKEKEQLIAEGEQAKQNYASMAIASEQAVVAQRYEASLKKLTDLVSDNDMIEVG